MKQLKAVLTLVLVFCTSLVMAQAPSSYPQGRGPLLNPNSERALLEALGVKPVNPLIMQEFKKALDENDAVKLETLLQQHPGILRQSRVGWDSICRPENCPWEVVNVFLKAGMDVNTPNKHGTTLLMLAVDRKSLKVVRNIITKADVNATDENGNPALRVAIQGGSLEVVKLLLKHGAQVNWKHPDGLTPLHYAVLFDRYEIVQELLKNPSVKKSINKKNSNGETALWLAAYGCNIKRENISIAEVLLSNGADPNIRCHAVIAINRDDWYGNPGIVAGTTPLSELVGSEYWNRERVLLIKKLIDHGAVLRENMWKPSEERVPSWIGKFAEGLSAEEKAEQIALRREAIEYMQIKSALSHQQMNTFMLIAVRNWPDDQALDFMKWALNHGWYFGKLRGSETDTLNTLLYIAIERERYRTIAYLLDNGADVNILRSELSSNKDRAEEMREWAIAEGNQKIAQIANDSLKAIEDARKKAEEEKKPKEKTHDPSYWYN